MARLSFEPRRKQELQDELMARARTWLADWHPPDEREFATALFKVAARIASEVTQRLDRAPDKAFRGFLDWLGVQGRPAKAARLPVVFAMTPGSDPVDAPERVQMQVLAGATPINFETQSRLRILPGRLDTIVAVDPGADGFFEPPAGISPTEAPAQVPNEWRLKSDTTAESTTLQLDPPVGLDGGLTLIDPVGRQYRVTDAKGAMVTIEPRLDAALAAGDLMRRSQAFAPFGASERNRQEHALYIGSADGLNVEAAANILIENGESISTDAVWWYSGKKSASAPVDWIQIKDVTPDVAGLVLHKPKGAIESMKIDGVPGRWLRATRAPGAVQIGSMSGLRLLVNCEQDWDKIAAVPAVEGIANTTPLVLDGGFYPFGREPRQFDSFYIGSKEAFSKPSAYADLRFELGGHVSNARAAVALSGNRYLTAGVGADHRLQFTGHAEAGGRPIVSFPPATQPEDDGHRPIPLNTDARPGAASLADAPYVSAAANAEVWVWRQAPGQPEWQSQGVPFTRPDGSPAVVTQTMLVRSGTGLKVYAIADGKLFARLVDSGAWQLVFPDQQVTLVSVVPIQGIAALAGEQDDADGLVAMTDQGELRLFDAGSWSNPPGGPAELAQDFYPLVVRTASNKLLCAAREKAQPPGQPRNRPVAFDLKGGPGYTEKIELVGHTLDFRPVDDRIVVVMIARDGSDPATLFAWDAFEDVDPEPQAAPAARLVEGPILVGTAGAVRFFYSAGENGEAFIAPVGQLEAVSGASVTDAVLFTDAATDWTQKDHGFPVDLDPVNPGSTVGFVDKVYRGSAPNTWVLQLSDATDPPSTATSARLHSGLHDDLRSGNRQAPRTLELAGDDAEAATTASLYVTDGTHLRIFPIDTVVPAPAGGSKQVKVPAAGPVLPGTPGSTLTYKIVDPGTSQTITVRPFVDVSGLDASLIAGLKGSTLEFDSESPSSQIVADVPPGASLAVLGSAWTATPAGAVDFVAQVVLFAGWETFEPSKTHKPTLSWEYFDGTAWRLIEGLTDSTDNLARSGDVRFCVPANIQPTDVVGHKNHWVRARLVGGDYGEATVVVTTTPGDTPNSTKQTVDRNPDSIQAPYAGSLTVKYRVCCPVIPDAILTRDNGALLNQTSVNANGGVVEHFVPLAAALDRAAGGDSDSHAADRALYLGFDTPLTGGPIQILFLVDEGKHDAAFPLRVDALTGNRFKPVVAKDGTRGLNESGVLELAIAESPQLMQLFGMTKYWLRLRPSARLTTAGDWLPSIRAAYLNATWALAAQTQEVEPLGSSDGSPGQRFGLARPPVLENTLRLRVYERLGDEEADKLKAAGIDIQKRLPDIPERRGWWVLWKQVPDPLDEAPDARVYALDDAEGIITFGDGLHGMIPPIGTDVILAESYQRGGGEAANGAVAWSQINLVTALSGVSGVVAPEGAAGGSDPQDADTTVRFAPDNLRVRDRALTLADFEALTRQFSRDVAQARALRARDGTRLVVVMRGRNAQPRAAQIRELRSYLASRSAPLAADPDRLRIGGPDEVGIRVALDLIVDAIESSGEVAAAARRRLEDLLDPAQGWPLGQALTDTDVAGALVDMPHLEGIASILVTRTDGSVLTSLKPYELVRLAPDGVAIAPVVDQEAVA